MKKQKKILLGVLATTLILGSTTTAFAVSSKAGDLFPGSKSFGVFQFDNDNDGTPEIVVDSDDMKTIYTNVTDGKKALATEINNATKDAEGKLPGGTTDTKTDLKTEVGQLPSFETLKDAIANVKQAGVESAYKEIATDTDLTDTDKHGVKYSAVKDLATLKEAIDEDNKNHQNKGAAKVAGTQYIYLGTGSSWSIPGYYEDYTNLTSNDFVIYATGTSEYISLSSVYDHKGDDIYISHSISVTPIYDAATGLLTTKVNKDGRPLSCHSYCSETQTPTGLVAFIKVPN